MKSGARRWALDDPEIEVLRVKNRFGRAYDSRLTAGLLPSALAPSRTDPARPAGLDQPAGTAAVQPFRLHLPLCASGCISQVSC